MEIKNIFKDLIPPLSHEEYRQLEENILSDGIRDPLVLWGETLIDGHNRYEIAQRHGLPFRTVQHEFDDEYAAVIWIMQNQLGRRNLNDFQRVELAHKCESIVKEKAERRMTAGKVADPKEKFPEGMQARDELGAMAGVSGKTYEHAVTVIESAPEAVKNAVRNSEISINAAYAVTKMEPENQHEIAARIEQGETPRKVVQDITAREKERPIVAEPPEEEHAPSTERKPPHVSYNGGNNEWYTPVEYIEAARSAMGSIDLDPASSEIANRTVKAAEYFTAETNGLDKKWYGNIWLNPPYASDLIGRFMDKLTTERDYHQAIVLVNNATETEWFLKLIGIAGAAVFPRGRVKFLDPDGKPGAPLQGQAVVYIGDAPERFLKEFRHFGWGCTV